MTKWVYTFGTGETEGAAEMRNLLGGKRENRLKLLSQIRASLEGVADFSKIEGGY